MAGHQLCDSLRAAAVSGRRKQFNQAIVVLAGITWSVTLALHWPRFVVVFS